MTMGGPPSSTWERARDNIELVLRKGGREGRGESHVPKKGLTSPKTNKQAGGVEMRRSKAGSGREGGRGRGRERERERERERDRNCVHTKLSQAIVVVVVFRHGIGHEVLIARHGCGDGGGGFDDGRGGNTLRYRVAVFVQVWNLSFPVWGDRVDSYRGWLRCLDCYQTTEGRLLIVGGGREREGEGGERERGERKHRTR